MRFPAKDESLPRRPWAQFALGVTLALATFQLLAPGQQQNASEDQVKVAYLFTFAKLAEWPLAALPDGPAPLVIGVSGGDEQFLGALKSIVAGKVVGTHSLMVKSVGSVDDMKSCHMVFFRASERKRTHEAIKGWTQAGVLLVGEDESFLRQGGMINLVKDHGSVRFEINPDALDRSQIRFSAKILALAKAGGAHTTTSSSPAEGSRQVERGIAPEYPAIAEKMKLAGTAQVQALVKPDGTVKDVRILGGHPLLADALARAVRQWKYQPAPRETMEVVKFSFGPQ